MIVFLSRLFHPHVGGVEKHVKELSKRLVAGGNRVTIITTQFVTSLPLEEDWGGLQIMRIPHVALFSKQHVWLWMLGKLSFFKEAEVVHVHDVFWWYWPIRLLMHRKPVYITYHGYEGSGPPTWKAIGQRKAAELASKGSICIGDFMRTWYFARPNTVLYGAADLINKRSQAVTSKRAAFWGRFDYDTGIDMYVEAMKHLPDWRLDVYGDGPLKNSLPALRNVFYHSWEPDVVKIIKDSRYAFVSRYLSIVEAMQGEKLVAAVYNNRIKQDYLSCHPMHDSMVTAGNSTELATRLRQLSCTRERKMIETASKWAHRQTWERVVKAYKTLWQN